jgi:hypothetical protein
MEAEIRTLDVEMARREMERDRLKVGCLFYCGFLFDLYFPARLIEVVLFAMIRSWEESTAKME